MQKKTKQNFVDIKEQREFLFTDRDFKQIADLILEATGIFLAEHKKDLVYGRIVRRVRALRLKTFAEYINIIKSDNGKEEVTFFVNALTTNLTEFFREKHHFDHLVETVLPNILSKKSKVDIWSSACSSGMEPYSIAMTIKNFLEKKEKFANINVTATDIDTNMLKKAEKAVYSEKDVKSIPKVIRLKYMNKIENGNFEIAPIIKKMVNFRKVNLQENWGFISKFDLIFCRNVMIYFSKDTQKTLVERFASQIHYGGYLYIGHSENICRLTDKFLLEGKTIYKKL